MKETNKARSAFEDYYNMGPGRSLVKLMVQYQTNAKAVPTKHISRLKVWSTEHGWQERGKHRDREVADAAMEEIKERASSSGYSIWQKRVFDLNIIAERIFGLISVGGLPPGLLREFRALLDDIATEMGERTQKIEIMDWREELRKHDVEPSKIFEEYVRQFMEVQSDATD